MLLFSNSITVFMLRQLMQPHVPGVLTSTKLNSLQHSTIHEQTFKKTTVLSAFRQTGLIPFNPEIVLDKLSEPVSESGSRPGSIPNLNTRSPLSLTIQLPVTPTGPGTAETPSPAVPLTIRVPKTLVETPLTRPSASTRKDSPNSIADITKPPMSSTIQSPPISAHTSIRHSILPTGGRS